MYSGAVILTLYVSVSGHTTWSGCSDHVALLNVGDVDGVVCPSPDFDVAYVHVAGGDVIKIHGSCVDIIRPYTTLNDYDRLMAWNRIHTILDQSINPSLFWHRCT